jgi:3-methyladenine DNA glycosylase AlkD
MGAGGNSLDSHDVTPRSARPGARDAPRRTSTANQILDELRANASERNREGQARFGIQTARALGISVTALRGIAKRAGKDHQLAGDLWASGVHEARILASMVDPVDAVTESQMEAWAADFDSWDLVDQCCSNLFARTPFAYPKANEWAGRDEEFVKRAGFSLIAAIAVHDKKAPDERLMPFLTLIEREADDPRNFVRKAVNWALRSIGKRSLMLRDAAIETAERIRARGRGPARWVASDALRELRNAQVIARIRQ